MIFLHDVFISYKAEEFDDANWVKTALETNGIRCWMAPMSIPGGSNYAKEIPQAIREAKVFVLILSERSQLSTWVPKELDQAINEGKTIMPFMLENCRLKDDFNFYLSNVQRYAAYANKSAAIEKMIREIRAILGTSAEAPAPEAEPAPAPETKIEPAPEPASEPKPAKKTRPEKKPAPKAEKKRDDKKPGRRRVLAIVLAALVVIVGCFAVMNRLRTVVVAGKKYKVSDTYVSIEGARLTEKDVKSLGRFKSLSTLILSGCELPGSGLEGIVSNVRTTLKLSGCGVTDAMLDAAPLAGSSIAYLTLDGNPGVTGLRALAPLAGKLRELSFAGCGVRDLSELQGFTALRDLSCAGNGVSSLEPLSGCAGLERLDASGNALTSLDGLAACEGLRILDAGGNALTSLKALENCIYLTTIRAANNALESLDGLNNATLLTEVDLSGNRIDDVSLLAKSKEKLEKVDLSDNALTDVGALAGCAAIREFRCGGNALTSLDALAGCAELERLDAHGCALTDVSFLSGCEKLYFADLADNRISDVSPIRLQPDKYGTKVDLRGNGIRELSLPAVRYDSLILCGNPIDDLSTLEGASGTKLVFDYSAGIDYTALAQTGFTKFIVLDCPLDTQVALKDTLGTYRVQYMTTQEYNDSEKGN